LELYGDDFCYKFDRVLLYHSIKSKEGEHGGFQFGK